MATCAFGVPLTQQPQQSFALMRPKARLVHKLEGHTALLLGEARLDSDNSNEAKSGVFQPRPCFGRHCSRDAGWSSKM